MLPELFEFVYRIEGRPGSLGNRCRNSSGANWVFVYPPGRVGSTLYGLISVYLYLTLCSSNTMSSICVWGSHQDPYNSTAGFKQLDRLSRTDSAFPGFQDLSHSLSLGKRAARRGFCFFSTVVVVIVGGDKVSDAMVRAVRRSMGYSYSTDPFTASTVI